jgi:hypothetical protein
VLTVGDELRPTGTDRGLLRRISEQSGGKLRDTLAGIFLDRDAVRFAYTPLSSLLLCLAAFSLLLAVAARRLSAPEGLERFWHELRTSRPAPVTRAASPPEAAAPPPTAVGALQRLKTRKAAPPAEEPPPSVPSFSRPPPLPKSATSSQPPTPTAPPSGPTPTGARQPTAAEILLARRRGRKP